MIKKMTLLIYGCGGHSRSVADILLSNDPDISMIFIDEKAQKEEKRYNFDVLNRPPSGDWPCFIAIGDNQHRRSKFLEINEKNLISIISSHAYVSKMASIGAGCFIGNYSHIGPEAVVGICSIINTGAIIEHEVAIGNFTHISPNSAISGRSTIGSSVFVGTGAAIRNCITICSNVIIGAGATVVKDINEPGIYVGCPARRIK